MDTERQVSSYTWHQSHDQATVLLVVPYETLPDDAVVVIEDNFLVAGVRGQPPIIKGQLYGSVNTATSVWQLEPRGSARGRTISTTSTVSTQSSYAFISDPEISSSFAASLDSGQVSDSDDVIPSPRIPSPPSRDEQLNAFYNRYRAGPSHPSSPRFASSLSSSISSSESLQTGQSGRLLTLHLEKEEPSIWPSLVVGPVPDSLSPSQVGPYSSNVEDEAQYNLDPTSLGLIADDLLIIRGEKEQAFEYFVRAWYQAHTPLSTLRLVSHYLPINVPVVLEDLYESVDAGTPEYFIKSLGGNVGLARLYTDAGMRHLEGTASTMLTAYSALSSIRTIDPRVVQADNSTETWRRDRDTARQYFERAQTLCPDLDLPLLGTDDEEASRRQCTGQRNPNAELKMPSVEMQPTPPPSPGRRSQSSSFVEPGSTLRPRRARTKEASTTSAAVEQVTAQDVDDDSAWYLYLPGVIGAGTALLVVGVVSAISFSSWRKNQG